MYIYIKHMNNSTRSVSQFKHKLPRRLEQSSESSVTEWSSSLVHKLYPDRTLLEWKLENQSYWTVVHENPRPSPTTDTPSPTAKHSRKERLSGSKQTSLYQKKLLRQYNQRKSSRKDLSRQTGMFLIVESNDQDTQNAVYRYLKHKDFPHTKTSKSCEFYDEGVHQEYYVEDVDAGTMQEVEYYLRGFEPSELKYDFEDRS